MAFCQEDLNFLALADPLATTVVFMGQRTFPSFLSVCLRRIAHRYARPFWPKRCPHPEQTLRFTTVGALADDLAKGFAKTRPDPLWSACPI